MPMRISPERRVTACCGERAGRSRPRTWRSWAGRPGQIRQHDVQADLRTAGPQHLPRVERLAVMIVDVSIKAQRAQQATRRHEPPDEATQRTQGLELQIAGMQ